MTEGRAFQAEGTSVQGSEAGVLEAQWEAGQTSKAGKRRRGGGKGERAIRSRGSAGGGAEPCRPCPPPGECASYSEGHGSHGGL